MEYVYIGKIVSTHGIKGEIKIISDFPFKTKVFKVDNRIYIGKNKKEEVISSYRRHKNYDMITLKDYDNINQVLTFMKEDVYVNKEDLHLSDSEYLDSDLIGLSLYSDTKYLGTIIEVFSPSPNNKVIRFEKSGKNYLVPYVKNFIKEIDFMNKKVVLYSMEGVLECV